jgi:hypothetical protein
MADDDVKTEETFTRGQVRAMIGAEVKKVREQFADYDDLKARAAEADQSKGKIDQVLEKLAIADKRAADAELATMRRDVADELGLTAKQARKLHGSTRDELLADGQELIEDFGIKPKGNSPAAGKDTNETETEDAAEATGTEVVAPEQAPARSGRPPRPRETLRSGAPVTKAEPEVTDPAALAALVPRR